MSDNVYKTVEITGTASEDLTKAIDNAIAKAAKTLRDIDWFEVTQIRGHVEGGKVAHYQATMKIGFKLED